MSELNHRLIDDEVDGNFGRVSIKVLGVGGGGCNAVSRMYNPEVPGVEYYCLNTDQQHLEKRVHGPHKVPIGVKLTRGLGSGGNPDVGRQAAEESREVIKQIVSGADMVFVTAGMGGGTGTGAAPVVAQVAKEAGSLVVAVVTRPFGFEAGLRRRNAEEGIKRLKEHVDTLITIPNDKVLELVHTTNRDMGWEEAMRMVDSVLEQGIQTIAEVIAMPGEINVDFANVRSVLSAAGPAWLAIGRAKGDNRAVEAARQAIRSPLLDISIEGAKRILFIITGGNNLSLREIQQAAETIQEIADPEAAIFFGTNQDPTLEEELKVTLVASAFPATHETLETSEQELRRLLSDVLPQEEEELDVPSFLRRKNRRFLR